MGGDSYFNTINSHTNIECLCTYLLLLERKYCNNCDWWWEPGFWMFFVISLIPVIGIFSSIAGCVDFARNIIKELTK